MKTVIVSGGSIREDFALDFLKELGFFCHREQFRLIAADRGMEFCLRQGWVPEQVVGDFDSGDPSLLKEWEGRTTVHRLRPEKDDSDTQSAAHLAVSLGCEALWILGATGSRMDHVLANLGLLCYGLQEGIPFYLADAHNLISAHREGFSLRREAQFGRFVSFFPLEGPVEGLTLSGFKYPLKGHFLQTSDSGLTVSNEILEETARVEFSKGTLLMIQSRD